MAEEGVEVKVQSQLQKIVEDLLLIQKGSVGVSAQLKSMGADIGKLIKAQNKELQDGLDKTKTIGQRVADQLRKDFQALFSVATLTGGLSIANQFKGSVTEALTLSDTVRSLGHVFGIAGSDFLSFQSKIQKGFGEIGLSSEAAANAIKGLSETPVRGQNNILAFAKTASELAAVSGERGNEGGVAKGLVGSIQARGGNAQNPEELARASREVLQIQTATGRKASEVTAALTDLYAHTNADFRKQMNNGGAVTLASAALKAGPGGTAFLESFLSQSKNQRAGMEAQGLGHLIGKNGQLDPKAFAATIAEANRRMPGNTEGGLATMGIQGGDQAKGFMRLAEVMKTESESINGASRAMVDLDATFSETMGAADSFRASLNRVKGEFSDYISAITQGGTNLLQATSHSTAGAAATVGAGGILSAVATGIGLKGAGAALGLGGGAAAAGGTGAAGGAAAAGGSALLGPAAVAAAIGLVASDVVQHIGSGSAGDDLSELISLLKDYINGKPGSGGFGSPGHMAEVKVKVETNKRELRVTPKPGRGTTQ